jgi:hypothetical protein
MQTAPAGEFPLFAGKPLAEVSQMATYELVRETAQNSPAEVVGDLPPVEPGAVLFHNGHFWRVDAVEPAHAGEADSRLILSLTTDEPEPGSN